MSGCCNLDGIVPNNFDFAIDFSLADDLDETFKMMSEKEINDFIGGQKAKTTKYKDSSDSNTFRRFCQSINERREIDEIPTSQLDNILCQFFMNATKRNGGLYEPDTLSSIRNSLQRVLFDKGSKLNIREGDEFIKSRQVLSSRRKQLTKLGKGNAPNATRPLSDEEVDLLYQNKYFGDENPMSLQRTVWWQLTKQFGHRARDESRQLKFGDVKIETDVGGTECLTWLTERSTKTRNGERPMGHKRKFDPKAFATGKSRCPVVTFKKFVSHRPIDMCNEDSPFFLRVRYNIDPLQENVWYFSAPLGVNSIGGFLSKASNILSNAGATSFKGKVANHSARKTSITNLLNENTNPLYVKQLSGHKKMESLETYNIASRNQQQAMSNVLSGDKSGKKEHFNQCGSSSKSLLEGSISQEFQRQMMQPWNPVLPTSFNAAITHQNHSALPPAFQGATIQNCTFNINISYKTPSSPEGPKRK